MLYVGKAKDLKARVSSYFTNQAQLGEKTRMMVSQAKTIDITIVESEVESLLLEAFYIKKFKPKYNIRMADDKAYPYIRITVKDDYPAILLERRAEDPNSLYYGPFPSAGAVRMVLKTLRRIYPFLMVRNHPKRICLYNHLGLCVCPPVNDSPELKKEYKKYIRNIIRILEGESQKLQKELEKERDSASKDERFEEAATLQKRIDALHVITEPFIRPLEYDVNPNLREDIRSNELSGLQKILNESGLHVAYPERIECYDISNIQGTNATGSMVVLTLGEIDKSQYRKFKIRRDWEKRNKDVISNEVRDPKKILKQVQDDRVKRGFAKKEKPNDFAMMQEMLERRLKHDEWQTPSLIVVDGGKGQLTSVLKAMEEKDKHIPIVGLAKREETIIIPVTQESYDPTKRKENDSNNNYLSLYGANDDNFVEVSLPKDTPALQLVMRIRNEAHRFAITYHRKLRSKAMTK